MAAQALRQAARAEKHLVVGNHDLEPTQALPWTSVTHLAEVRDGPQSQAHTLCRKPSWLNALVNLRHLLGSTKSVNAVWMLSSYWWC